MLWPFVFAVMEVPLKVAQLPPPSSVYSAVDPASKPATVMVPSVVWPSAATPVSFAKVSVAAVAGVWSSVKARTSEGSEVTSKVSVWRAWTFHTPSVVGTSKLAPEPACQLTPSVEYSHVPSRSNPLTLTVVNFVTRSELDEPLSVASVSVGANGM